MSADFILLFFIPEPNSHPRSYTQQWGHSLRSEHIRPQPNWTAIPPAHQFSGNSSSAALGCERGVCSLLQTSGVIGVNSPTRGRFTAMDRNHLSALCCLSPNEPDRAALSQSHHSEKCPKELKMNRWDTSWCMVVFSKWRILILRLLLREFHLR